MTHLRRAIPCLAALLGSSFALAQGPDLVLTVPASATEADLELPADPIGDQFQGGGFCAMEFAGDVERIT